MRLLTLVLLGVLCCVESAAAVTAEDLENMPISDSCTQDYINIALMFGAKQRGLTKDQAMDTTRTASPQYKIDPVTIEYAYANPNIREQAIASYALFACHARKNGLPTLSLSEVAQELNECARQKTDLCARQVKNMVWKLTRDFVPKPSSSVLPPPVQPKR